MSLNGTQTPTIDLRSDTVTTPTEAMRQAMKQAEVGDDVYGEDPTVNELESIVADVTGKEAAVFVPSGTMGNLISVLAHCGRGDEMILGDNAHIYIYEQGGSAALGGVHPRSAPNLADGTIPIDLIEQSIRGDNEHFPITRLIALENTHNRCGGRVLTLDYLDAVGNLARERGLQLHVDGARLWNAAVALNVSPARVLQNVDSASLCLSKGLAAPVGSVVVGSAAFIKRARRMRKVVGGSMRQAGVIAAAGILAVTQMVERLADDHANAKRLATGLNQIDGIAVDPTTVDTNIVIFELTEPELTPAELAQALQLGGVLLNPIGGQKLRAVTHYQISSEDIHQTLALFQRVMADPKAALQKADTSATVHQYG